MEQRTYRHPKLDVEVSLARLESMIRGKEDGSFVRVGNSPLMGGGMAHADVWNVKVLVEELRAQLEEHADQAEQTDTDPKIGGVDLGEAVRLGLVSITWGPTAKAILGALNPDFDSTPAREVDDEALGDLAADIAEAVAVRVLDGLPTRLAPGSAGRVVDGFPERVREEALEFAVRSHPQGRSDHVVAVALAYAEFLVGKSSSSGEGATS